MHYGDVDISGGSKTTLVGVTTRSSGLSFMSIRHVNTERPTARQVQSFRLEANRGGYARC